MLAFRHLCTNVFTKRNVNIYLHKNLKSVLSVHTSSKVITDVPQSEKKSVLVYQAPLKTRIKIVKYLSLSSSVIGFSVFPTVIIDLNKLNILLACAAGGISIFFLSTPIILNWITRRYVLELHFDKENKIFTAKTFNIVNCIKEIKFQASDVTVPDLPGIFTSFLVNGKPLFVDASMIQDPDAYSHMMGYDKPFDITMSEEKNNDKAT